MKMYFVFILKICSLVNNFNFGSLRDDSSIPLYPISGRRSRFYNQCTAIAAFSLSLSAPEKTSDMMGDLKFKIQL
jgi:hypothetical protein